MGGGSSKIQPEKSSIPPKTATTIVVKPMPQPPLSPFVQIKDPVIITRETPSGVKHMLHTGFISRNQ